MKTCKFGGSSLATADCFRRVVKIIRADQSRRAIVVSAPGKRFPDDTKVTDLLYKVADYYHDFNAVDERFCEIVKDLDISLPINEHLERARRLVNCSRDDDRKDVAASRGEYLSAIIMANLIGYQFIDAEDFIKINNDGTLDLAGTKQASEKIRLSYYATACGIVVPGFYGKTPNGKIKTFPRGGSDISGAVVASCIDAEVYENWTDVSGLLTADPRIVEEPKKVTRVTYRDLRELAYRGASIFHEEAMFPVAKARIPTRILNTFAPNDEGTWILPEDALPSVSYSGVGLIGIAGRQGFTVITVEKAMMNQEVGFVLKVLSVLERNHISFEMSPSGIDTISFVISDKQIGDKLKKIESEIREACNPDALKVTRNISMIAVVGQSILRKTSNIAIIFGALSDFGIDVTTIDFGQSGLSIIIGVGNQDFSNAIRVIYYALSTQ